MGSEMCIRDRGTITVVGPHPSTTPSATVYGPSLSPPKSVKLQIRPGGGSPNSDYHGYQHTPWQSAPLDDWNPPTGLSYGAVTHNGSSPPRGTKRASFEFPLGTKRKLGTARGEPATGGEGATLGPSRIWLSSLLIPVGVGGGDCHWDEMRHVLSVRGPLLPDLPLAVSWSRIG